MPHLLKNTTVPSIFWPHAKAKKKLNINKTLSLKHKHYKQNFENNSIPSIGKNSLIVRPSSVHVQIYSLNTNQKKNHNQPTLLLFTSKATPVVYALHSGALILIFLFFLLTWIFREK